MRRLTVVALTRTGILMRLAVALVCLGGPAAASAATVSFADLAVPGTGAASFGATVFHDGFVFTSDLHNAPQGLSVWKSSDANHPAGGPGTTSLFDFAAGDKTTIARADGGTFGLNAIDLTNWGVGLASFPATFPVKFVGTKADASTVEQTFMVANLVGAPQLQTFSFVGFSNLVSVSVIQGIYGSGNAFQFDNLVYVLGPSLSCDTQVNHSTYVNGDPIQVSTLRFANPTSASVAAEIKVWLGTTAAPVSVINAGANGSAMLPPGLDVNLGPFTLFTVTPAVPRGGYEFSCRLLDPASGEVLAVKRSSFVIH